MYKYVNLSIDNRDKDVNLSIDKQICLVLRVWRKAQNLPVGGSLAITLVL